MRSLVLAAAMFAAVLSVAMPAAALPPPIFEASAQSEELRFAPVADLATADDGFAVVADNRAAPADRPALAYEAALFFEVSSDGSPVTAIAAFAPIDPGRMYIA